MSTRITITNPQNVFTCINCNVRFQTAEMQRDHYKSDWHRYNLKRRVNELMAITAEEFDFHVEIQRAADRNATLPQENFVCGACQKVFITKQSLDNHLNSRKHKDRVKQLDIKNKKLPLKSDLTDSVDVKMNDNDLNTKDILIKKDVDHSNVKLNSAKTGDGIDEDDEDFEIIDSDEWDEDAENVIEVNNCLFCKEQSKDMVANLKHMSVAHSFFIPDIEFTCDLTGLLEYLGIKITQDFICIWCNESGKTFYTLDAVQKHMIDKGHCKMLHEGSALAEYTDFYDYSSTYPEAEIGNEKMDIDEEITPDLLDGDEYQLVLPSGAVIGHRSLLRYYKQRLNPERRLAPSKSDRKLHKVLAEYRSLGWTNTQQQAAAKRASDIHHMKRQYQKLTMRLGVKANKLQRHFRQQVDF